MIKEEYSWNECEDGDWNNCIYSSREEALEDAKLYYPEGEEPGKIFTGKLVPYKPGINVYAILDNLNSEAYEEVGELAYDWEPYDFYKQEEITELNDAMNRVLWDWLEKYHRMPSFYAIIDIKSHKFNGDNYEK